MNELISALVEKFGEKVVYELLTALHESNTKVFWYILEVLRDMN